jgi:membrane protein YdbS with pleckstrin-like domain
MEPQPLDPRVVTLWRIQGIIRLFIVFAPLLVLAGVALSAWVGPLAAFAGMVPLGIFLGLLVLTWPVLSYQRFRYAVRGDDALDPAPPPGAGTLWIRQGVLFQAETVIPLSRIQHVDSRQGPIERILGLSRVMVFTASGMVPDGGLPGLDQARAADLRDKLARRGGADGV